MQTQTKHKPFFLQNSWWPIISYSFGLIGLTLAWWFTAIIFSAIVETWELNPVLNPIQRASHPEMSRDLGFDDVRPMIISLSDSLYHLIQSFRFSRMQTGILYSLHLLLVPTFGLFVVNQKGRYLARSFVINSLFLLFVIVFDRTVIIRSSIGTVLATAAIVFLNGTLLVGRIAYLVKIQTAEP